MNRKTILTATCAVVTAIWGLQITRAQGASLADGAYTEEQSKRGMELYKAPGVSETLDWMAALVALDLDGLDPGTIENTLGVVLKSRDDIEALRGEPLSKLLQRATEPKS